LSMFVAHGVRGFSSAFKSLEDVLFTTVMPKSSLSLSEIFPPSPLLGHVTHSEVLFFPFSQPSFVLCNKIPLLPFFLLSYQPTPPPLRPFRSFTYLSSCSHLPALGVAAISLYFIPIFQILLSNTSTFAPTSLYTSPMSPFPPPT